MSTNNVSPTQTIARGTNADPSRTREMIGSVVRPRFDVPSWVLLVELFIGFGWMRAAVEKIIDPLWWDGTALGEFLTTHADLTLPWYRGFLGTVVEPYLVPISIVVVVAQLFAGVTLVAGRWVMAGLVVGMFLNLNFVAAGAVDPSIFYLISQAAVMLWILQTPHQGDTAGSMLRWLPTASLVLLVVNLPFVSTLDPSAVIDDPAMILVFFGLLLAVSSRVASIRPAGQGRVGPGGGGKDLDRTETDV